MASISCYGKTNNSISLRITGLDQSYSYSGRYVTYTLVNGSTTKTKTSDTIAAEASEGGDVTVSSLTAEKTWTITAAIYNSSGSVLATLSGSETTYGSPGTITCTSTATNYLKIYLPSITNVPDSYYELNYWDNNGLNKIWDEQSYGGKTIPNLSPGTTYYFKYRYYKSDSWYTSWSSTKSFTTDDDVTYWNTVLYRTTGVDSMSYKIGSGSWVYPTSDTTISIATGTSLYIDLDSVLSGYEGLCWRWRIGSQSAALNTQSMTRLTLTQSSSTTVYVSQHIVRLPSTPTIVSNTGTSLIVNIPDVENAASYAASGEGGYYKVYSKLSTSSTWTQLTPARQESGQKTFVTTPGNTYHIRYCYEYSDGTTTFTGSYSDTLIVTAPSVNWNAELYYTDGVGSMSYKIGSGSWTSINATTTVSVPINTYLYVSVDSVASGYEKLCWKWRVGTETATLNTMSMSSTWSITQSSSTNVYLNPYLVGTPSTPTLVSNIRGSITIDISAVLNAATYASSGEGGYYKVFSRLQGSSTWISYSSGRQEAGNKPFATTPGNTYEFKYYYEYSDGSNTYTGSDSSILPVTAAGQFYWISSSQSVTTGYPVSSISYTKWNEFVEAIRTVLTSAQLSSSWSNTGTVRVSESLGFGYIGTKTTTSWLDYSKIDSSDKVLYYYKFNIVNHMLAQYISSHTYNQISTGQTVYASYFNNLQNYYNNNA